MRKLVNFCLALALVWGCAGGVLAAVVCAHLGCRMETAAPVVDATQNGHAEGHCHDAAAPAEQTSSNKTHDEHATEHASGERQQFERTEMSNAVALPHEGFCAHCVARPGTPPSAFFEQEFNAAKKSRDFAAPRAVAQVAPPSTVFRRKITPAQHAPPARSARHLLLLNVFRI
ncbi:MAG TPA: hypothetical protein VGW12_01440 [Pyrinomonadaceae bacterium]|nr:hypothetical protein [Pyrinomonadaceae bacterium]